MKIFKYALASLVILLTFTNCNKEAEKIPATPDEITSWLTYEDATTKLGNPPSPTENGPVLTSLTNSTSGVQGSNFIFKFSTKDNFSGIYLKVEGSSNYLDIPLKKGDDLRIKNADNSIFRIQEEEDDVFTISLGLSEFSEPQEFCYEYCLYDEEAGVSNIERVCAEITPGGNVSLVGIWDVVELVEYSDGVLNSLISNGKTDTILCEDSINSYRVTSTYFIEIKSNGEYLGEKELVVNEDDIICIEDQIKFYNKESILNSVGVWAFNVSTNTFLLIDFVNYYNLGTPIEYVEKFEIGRLLFEGVITSQTSTEITLRQVLGDDYYEISLKRQ